MECFTASIEPLTSIIRVHKDGGGYGDPYEWAATVRWIDPKTVEICAAVKNPKIGEARAIVSALLACGIKNIIIKRQRNGKEETHILTSKNYVDK